jgi:hypothetical protein
MHKKEAIWPMQVRMHKKTKKRSEMLECTQKMHRNEAKKILAQKNAETRSKKVLAQKECIGKKKSPIKCIEKK